MENPLRKYLDRRISFRISVANIGLIVWGFAGLIYVAWEAYWYNKVGLMFVKWHTHLFVYGLLFYGLALLGKIWRGSRWLGSLAVFVSVFLCAEVFLMLTGFKKTFYESKYNAYRSPYISPLLSHYHTWNTLESSHRLISDEFDYWRPTNSIGFADGEWKLPQETPGLTRILALGDSFTEGDGAPFDSSYVACLKRRLEKSGDSCYVMNGGICGSDPFENFMNLEHLLVRYKPRYVLQCISTNDLYTDIATRGGFERFLPDGGQRYRTAPWWEPVFAVSYVSRLFFSAMGYNILLINEDDTRFNEQLNEDLLKLFDRYTAFCRQEGITLLVFILPDRDEVIHREYRFDYSEMTRYLGGFPQVHVCSLMPHYVADAGMASGEWDSYYWPNDGHHNSRGYALMADGVFACLKPLLSHDSQGHPTPQQP